MTTIVKEQSRKSWNSIGIQFNKSWYKITEIMNSTLRDPIGIDENSISTSNPFMVEDSFDLFNNDVVTPKPNHEILQSEEYLNSVNNLRSFTDFANNVNSSTDKDSDYFTILKIKKKDQNLNSLKKRCAQLNREKFNLEKTEVKNFYNFNIHKFQSFILKETIKIKNNRNE